MASKQALKDLGLSDQETDVYISLLRSGGAIASVVAKNTGIKRTTVYALLKALSKKGFVTMYYRKNKQLYYAEKPQRVANHYEKKISSFVDLIPSLESLEKKQLNMVGLRFIETLDELKKFYNEILEECKGKDYKIIGTAKYWQGLDKNYFIKYRKDRAKAKIKTKLLLTEESKKDNPKDKNLLRDVKFLSKKYGFKSTMDIFNDKVLIISPELSSLAVVIAVPAMVDIFDAMFNIIWDTTN